MTEQTKETATNHIDKVYHLLENETEKMIHNLNDYQQKIFEYNKFVQERTSKFAKHYDSVVKVLKRSGMQITLIDSIYKTGNGFDSTLLPFEVKPGNSFYLRGKAKLNRVRTNDKQIHTFITSLQAGLKEATDGVISASLNSYGMRGASEVDITFYVY